MFKRHKQLIHKPTIVILALANALTLLSGIMYIHTYSNFEWAGRPAEKGAGWPIAFIGDDGGNSPLSDAYVISSHDWVSNLRPTAYILNVLLYSAIIYIFYFHFTLALPNKHEREKWQTRSLSFGAATAIFLAVLLPLNGHVRLMEVIGELQAVLFPNAYISPDSTYWLALMGLGILIWTFERALRRIFGRIYFHHPFFAILALASFAAILSGIVIKQSSPANGSPEYSSGWPVSFIFDDRGNGLPNSDIGRISVVDWQNSDGSAFGGNMLFFALFFWGAYELYNIASARLKQQKPAPRPALDDPHDWS